MHKKLAITTISFVVYSTINLFNKKICVLLELIVNLARFMIYNQYIAATKQAKSLFLIDRSQI